MEKVVKFISHKPFFGRRKNRNLRTKVATAIKGHDKASQDVSTVTGEPSQCDVSTRAFSSPSEAKMNFFWK